jgi:hypothetical protein
MLGIPGSIFISGCKNKCGSTTCQNGGTCSDNVCICPTGYSGNACQTGWSTQFLGTYNCSNENCNPAVRTTSTWQSAITVDATNGGYTVDISDFDYSNLTVAATVDSAGHITIATAAGGYGIDGSGTYNSVSQVIDLTYTTYSAGAPFNCHMILTKIQ